MNYLYVLQTIRESSPDFVNYIFVFISEILPKLILGFAIVIYWCVNKKEGASILLGYTSVYQSNQLIKNTACIYRPWIRDSRLHLAKAAVKSATGYSFPSGHTVTAASLCGGFAVYQKKRKWLVVLLALFVLLVAFSRNWLGAHTLADVLTAVVETGIMLILVNLIRFYLDKGTLKDTWVMIAGLVIAVVLILVLQLKKYPLDYDEEGKLICDPYAMLTDCYVALGMLTGSLLGWWLERHFVQFDTDLTKKQFILRLLCGALFIGVVYLLLKLILDYIQLIAPLSGNICHAVKYFIIFFSVLYVYPVCFNAVHKKNNLNENK